MVRFLSVLYPFSILLIFSSSERLLLYCTCHRCAANARIYAVSIFWIRIANVADLLYLCLFLFHSRNLTLNDLGRCCGIRVTRQCTAFGNYWSGSLLDYIGPWFPLVQIVFLPEICCSCLSTIRQIFKFRLAVKRHESFRLRTILCGRGIFAN